MKKSFFLSLLCLVPIILIVVTFELICRFIIDDGLNYEFEMLKYASEFKKPDLEKYTVTHVPNKKKRIMGAEIRTGEYGFRNSVLKTNKKNFLLIGDSMTLGFGADKTFSDHLNERFTNFNFLNSGIGNTNTILQINNFFINNKNLELDGIILNFFINDLEKIELKEKSFIYNLYSFTYFKYKILTLKYILSKKNFVDYYKHTFKDKNQLKHTIESIKKLNDYCKTKKIYFSVHFLPELNNIEDYPFKKEEEIIKNNLEELGINYIQGFKYLEKEKSEDLWVTFYDRHANNKAHGLIADYLENFLTFEFF